LEEGGKKLEETTLSWRGAQQWKNTLTTQNLELTKKGEEEKEGRHIFLKTKFSKYGYVDKIWKRFKKQWDENRGGTQG